MSILVIEDDEIDAMTLSRQLEKHGDDRFRLAHAADLASGTRLLSHEPFDLVLLDLRLPDGSGPGNVDRVKGAAPDTPIIVLSGMNDEETALLAVRRGAQDYLVKGESSPRALINSLSFAVERSRLIAEVEQSHLRENSLKEKFLSHVSHEMRTPLTAILQFVTILRDGIAGDLNDEQARYLDIVHRNSDQLKRMISTLMDATRCTHGKLRCMPTRYRLERVLEAAATNLQGRADEKGVAFEQVVAEDLPDAIVDAGRIEQVIVNLLENAIKFTPSGGSVRAELQHAAADGLLQITIDDTGPGIPEHAIGRVFDQLFQTEGRDVSRKGLGLGLHISREIVELHGGTIHAQNRSADGGPGSGTRFVVMLPAFQLVRDVDRLIQRARAAGGREHGVGLVALAIRGRRGAALAKGIDELIKPGVELLAGLLDGPDESVLPVRRFDRGSLAIVGLTPRNHDEALDLRRRLTGQLAASEVVRGSGARCEVRGYWLPVSGPDGDVADPATELAGRIEELIEELGSEGET